MGDVFKLANKPSRRQWKMLHLLYNYGGESGLTLSQLRSAGVDCEPDGIYPLINAGAAKRDEAGKVQLTPPAQKILEACMLGYKNGREGDFIVDFPMVFVIIPYKEPWEYLYEMVLKPAVRLAGLEICRADQTVQIGDLNDNVWSQLAASGVVLADISECNPNVFYELGIASAMGKDTIIIKRRNTTLPSDFKGKLHHEYDDETYEELKIYLKDTLSDWETARCADQVALLSSLAKSP